MGGSYFRYKKKHIRRIQEKYGEELQNKKVVCLYIADEYEYMDEELIDLLLAQTELHLKEEF